MAFQDGLSSFLATWSGVHTAFSFDQTNVNSGTDTQDANSSTYAQADTANYPNYGLAAQCNPDANGGLDIYILTDVCFLLYLPSSGYVENRTYGLFHNGGGTHAQSGWLRYATGVGWQLCINHNTSGVTREEAYYTLGVVSGWYCVGFQFEDNSGNLALWVNGTNVAETARTTTMVYGSGNPYIGNSNGREPTAWTLTNYNINGTGIIIANFIADNPNNDNTSPAGNGDTFYTDYYDAHLVVAASGGGASVLVSSVWEDVTSASVRVSGVWESVDSIHVRQGGTWREVWSAYTPIGVNVDPGAYANTVTNNSGPIVVGFDALVTGGDGTETYSWTLSSVIPSGTVSITAGASTSSVTVSFDNGSNLFRSATLNLTVDDGTSSDSASASISVTYGIPP